MEIKLENIWPILGIFVIHCSSFALAEFRHQFVRKNIPALVDQFLLKPIVGKKTYQKKIPCVIILNVKKEKISSKPIEIPKSFIMHTIKILIQN